MYFFNMFMDFSEREREKHQCKTKTSIGCLLQCLNKGLNLQSRYVPWLGLELQNFWYMWQHTSQGWTCNLWKNKWTPGFFLIKVCLNDLPNIVQSLGFAIRQPGSKFSALSSLEAKWGLLEKNHRQWACKIKHCFVLEGSHVNGGHIGGGGHLHLFRQRKVSTEAKKHSVTQSSSRKNEDGQWTQIKKQQCLESSPCPVVATQNRENPTNQASWPYP